MCVGGGYSVYGGGWEWGWGVGCLRMRVEDRGQLEAGLTLRNLFDSFETGSLLIGLEVPYYGKQSGQPSSCFCLSQAAITSVHTTMLGIFRWVLEV